MLAVLRFLELLALGVWLGGMVFFSFAVAPAAFAVLPSRQLAGELVTHALSRLYLLSYICGFAYLLSVSLEHRLAGGGLRAAALPLALVAVALLLVFFNQHFLGERMAGLRVEMTAAFGGVDHTPADDALRVRFNRYHRLSVWAISADLLLTLALLVLTVRRLH